MKTIPLTIILVVWWQTIAATACVPKNRGLVRLRRTYLGGCYEVDTYGDGTAVERLYLGGDYFKASSVLVKEGSNSSIYYILRDYLGSKTGVADSNGKLVEEYSYDAWGNRRDPLVQNPDMPQNYNSYSYCVNNPLKYTDLDGEFFIFTFLNAVTELFGNLFQHGINFSQYDWKRTENALKITKGMFTGNILQILNKWTYGFLNSHFGFLISQTYNFFGHVDDVTYLDGMVAMSGATSGGKAVTIGHYSLGPDNYQATWTDDLFVHEYGHYIQSQFMGSAYIPIVGIPSLLSAAIISRLGGIGVDHDDRWFEVDASKRGAKYFDKHYGRGKKGYNPDSPDYFNADAFKYGGWSEYKNLRTGSTYHNGELRSGKGKITFWDFLF